MSVLLLVLLLALFANYAAWRVHNVRVQIPGRHRRPDNEEVPAWVDS